MADEVYRFIYEGDSSKAIHAINEIVAAIGKLDQAVDHSAAKVKALGSDMSGLAKFTAGLQALDGHLKTTGAVADAASNQLRGVGKKTGSITSTAKKLDELTKQLQAATAAANAAAPALSGVGKAANLGGGGGGKAAVPDRLKGPLMLGGAAAAGLYMGGRKVIRAGSEGWEGQREYFEQAAEKAAAFRESLREVANLEGSPEVTDAVVNRQLDFQRHTGMDADEARAFREQYLGAIASGQQRGNIDQRTSADLEKEAGRFAVRYHLDPQVAGKMAGLVGEYQKVPTAAAGVGVMAEAAEHMNRYGVGQVRQMMGPMLGLAGEMVDENGGRFATIPRMAATYAATTIRAKSPAVAATQIRQANRGMRKFNGKEEEAFLRSAGVTPADDFEAAIRKLAPKITGPDGDLVLAQAGFGNSTERAAMISQAKLIPVVDENLRDKSGVIATARDRAVQNNEAAQGTVEGRARSADIAAERSDIENGLAMERLRAGRQAARARLADPNQPGGNRLKSGFAGGLKDFARSAFTIWSISGEDIRVDVEAIRALKEGARKVGIADLDARYPHLNFATGHQAETARDYSRAYEDVVRAGGDPYGGSPRDAARALRTAADALDRMKPPDSGGGPAGVPASAPPRVPSGGAGAGVVPGRR